MLLLAMLPCGMVRLNDGESVSPQPSLGLKTGSQLFCPLLLNPDKLCMAPKEISIFRRAFERLKGRSFSFRGYSPWDVWISNAPAKACAVVREETTSAARA